ncbi:MAG: peptidoglycan -binding protein [Pseudomonadota bacterium]
MALTRRSVQRMAGSIWPGFVDAMTALLLVLMFVLTIFMVVQAVQRETITGQESELDQLAAEVTSLSQALGLSQQRSAQLEDNVASLESERDQQDALISSLSTQLDTQARTLAERDAAIASFEEQVASLLTQRDDALAEGARLATDLADLEAVQQNLLSEQEALQLALARARDEIDAQAEEARLAAARREALEALTADLQTQAEEREATLAETLAALTAAREETVTVEAARLSEAQAAEALRAQLDETTAALTAEEEARLAEAAAAEALRARLADADAELTAMTLSLEERRQEAEDTLTLLAAANAVEEELNTRLADALIQLEAAQAANTESQSARDALAAEIAALREAAVDSEDLRQQLAAAMAARIAAEQQVTERLTEQERQETLLAAARQQLEQEEAVSTQAQREVEVLNQQIATLRSELDGLQGLLDAAAAADEASQIRIQTLGADLNQALARAAAEEKRRAELEAAEAERLRLEAERLSEQVTDLAEYRSEFFGTLRQVLGDREGIQIVGDRFVFSSEVLFESASATLSPEGQDQIAQVAGILSDVSDQIPGEIDWIIRVDGHTDNIPLSGTGAFADNWELSQARALSVVKYLTDGLGFPPQRLAATGFGEYRPVNADDTPIARAQNRRIELKLTER